MYMYNVTKLETNYFVIVLKYFCQFILIIISYLKLFEFREIWEIRHYKHRFKYTSIGKHSKYEYISSKFNRGEWLSLTLTCKSTTSTCI